MKQLDTKDKHGTPRTNMRKYTFVPIDHPMHTNPRHASRRQALAALGAMALGMCAPLRVWAQVTWNRAAFEARSALEALRALGAQSASESRDILIDAPQIAENGALVPIDITSQLAGTRTISVIAEKNPFPLAVRFEFRDGALPYARVNLKLSESTLVRVVVEAGTRVYQHAREIKVTAGGCGN